MSGTSLDGIDVCLVEFNLQDFKIVEYQEFDYNPDIKQKVIAAINHQLTLSQLTSLHYELGEQYAEVIGQALELWNQDYSSIDVIANHGQTIYHNDNKPGTVASTMQLGCGDVIKQKLNIDVVTDFRAADIAVGNSGAPLVQIFDQYLVESLNLENSSFLNIGGIANIYIDRLGVSFDTGPGNMMINYAMSKLYQCEYDRDGVIAASGQIDQQLLADLLSHSYFSNSQQRSTGREDFGDEYTEQILNLYRHLKPEDVIATLTMFTAKSIANEYLKLETTPNGRIYVSGGGAYNQTLIKFLQGCLEFTSVASIDQIGVGADAKEAVAFAYFGFANYRNMKLKTLNGKQTILGVLHKRG